MKQTAVEWLTEQYLEQYNLLDSDLYLKAKEMEKQQIINAVKFYTVQWVDAEQYYNETFKTKQND